MGAAPSRLILNVDYGSSLLRVWYQAVRTGGMPAETETRCILFECCSEVEQTVIWTADRANTVFGKRAVEKYLRDRPSSAGEVIHKPKLALLDEFRSGPYVQAFYKIAGIPPDDHVDGLKDNAYHHLTNFFIDHLRAIRKELIMYSIDEAGETHATEDTIDAWQRVTETTMTIACKSSTRAKETLLQALARAKYGAAQLQLKPLGVAFAKAETLAANRQVGIGDILLVINAGCSTTDVAAVQFIPPAQVGRREIDLRVLDPIDGAESGGNMINTAIYL